MSNDSFFIAPVAETEIRRILRDCPYPNPVARLYERAVAGDLFSEITKSLVDGTKTQEEADLLAANKYEQIKGQLQFSLMVGADNRDDFSKEDVCELRGIPFVFPAGMLDALRNYHLTFENNNFLLKDESESSKLLRDVVSRLSPE